MNASASDIDLWITRRRRTVLGELAWLGLLGTAAALQIAAIIPAFLRPDLIDFAAFVDNAKAWSAGTPYPITSHDPNVPHVIALFTPFIGMPLRPALGVWLAIGYGAALAALICVERETDLRLSAQVRTAALALFLAAPPSLDVVTNGNMVWPLWLLFTTAWVLARRGHHGWGGALMGVLATAKPFLGLWLPYYAFRRDWRALVGALLGVSITMTLSVWVTGWSAWTAWLDMLGRITWYDSRFNASIMGLVARIAQPALVPWTAGAVVVAVATFAWMGDRRTVDRDWLLLLLAALLISPLGWRYYLCFAVGPAVGLWRRGLLAPHQIASLLLLAVSPALDSRASSMLVRVTVGSLAFWSLGVGWIAIGAQFRFWKTAQRLSA